MAVGPLVGGVLIDAVGWRAIFVINLPVGVVAALFVRGGVPETPRHTRPVDRPGLAAGLLLIGVSSTMVFSALISLLIANVRTAQSGLASGVQNTLRQSGALIAVAILGSLLNTPSPASRLPTASAALVAVAVIAVTVAVCNLRTADAPWRPRPPRPSAACDLAERLLTGTGPGGDG
jgi:DHA2 family methylenomycin A resistance protein-like MFS transporter